MSYAGHVLDMINRIKYNSSLVESSRQRYSRIRKSYNSIHRKHEIHLKKFKDIPKDQLERIKIEVRAKLKRERKIAVIKTTVSTAIIIVLIAFIIYIFLDSRDLLG